MNMTMTQKILAAHAGKAEVRAGELVMARLDLVLGNDITAPVAIKEFPKFGRTHVFDRAKVALVPDHFTPNKDIKAAAQCAAMRAFAKEQGIANYFEVGHDCGIEHALLPEKGLVTAGDLVIGADSHTCTYGALGAFATGVGSTDMAAGMSAGETWFRVPEAIRVVLKGKPRKWVGGKDAILHLIGILGVDGARYRSLEFTGDGTLSLIPTTGEDATLHIEDGYGNTYEYEIDIVPEHICSGEEELYLPATQYHSGYMVKCCDICDEVIDIREVAICSTHSLGDWSFAPDATCTEAGFKSRTCSVCGYTENVDIPALGHSVRYYGAVEATCTA
ncbi:MAG: hypothetical protein IJQ00_04425, partial [Kiritimatiellae bacterium]|nr:hypothetical protein [Kiritimatiellia bacterium]